MKKLPSSDSPLSPSFMKSQTSISSRATRWLAALVCGGLFAAALPAIAADDDHHEHDSGHGNYVHHYNSHYNGGGHYEGGYGGGHEQTYSGHGSGYSGHGSGHNSGHAIYSHGYRGHSSYGHSSYGHSRHSSFTFSF